MEQLHVTAVATIYKTASMRSMKGRSRASVHQTGTFLNNDKPSKQQENLAVVKPIENVVNLSMCSMCMMQGSKLFSRQIPCVVHLHCLPVDLYSLIYQYMFQTTLNESCRSCSCGVFFFRRNKTNL